MLTWRLLTRVWTRRYKGKGDNQVKGNRMSKTIYYIGAGASYGEREDGKIVEGIPIVKEIPAEFDDFRAYIANAEIPEGDIIFQDLYRTGHNDVEDVRRYMLHDIDSLINGIKEHATIDTYARKLYLTGRKRDFERLKTALCAFFVWEQLEHKPDGRYDTFLANVLDENTLNIPKGISFVSWNYDSQMELAFRAYRLNKGLAVFEKNIVGPWPILTDCGRIFKVNGSATFADTNIVSMIRDYKETSVDVQLIQFYGNSMCDTSQMGFQFKTHLSFAWEDSLNSENMMRSLIETLADTEQVVVIGYSFPFFNRTTDREIFKAMPKLKKVYVQDINPSAVMQTMSAVTPEDRKIEIVPVSDCSQFYLPSEL